MSLPENPSSSSSGKQSGPSDSLMGLALQLRALLSGSWSGKHCKAVGCCSGSVSKAFSSSIAMRTTALGGRQACRVKYCLIWWRRSFLREQQKRVVT